MNTPICDFVHRYASGDTLRLHMPGHKGVGPLGVERLDITEISGADSLYEAEGIIAESERNASALFGCPTFYSTEGSSQCIRAMLHLATCGKKGRIAAARNVHKTFLSAAALLGIDIDWLYCQNDHSYLSCLIDSNTLESYLGNCRDLPDAVYVTSPDYLGNMLDIGALSQICHRYGVLLLVDNAHGAYLRFLPESLHPMDLGADICCDSAHKTLPVLTGGAYLHIRDKKFYELAKNALALFGSTSPSYLILQSLDWANIYLSQDFSDQLEIFVQDMAQCKSRLKEMGYQLVGNEPMKLTLAPKNYGYRGFELAQILRNEGIECEFSDPDFIVFMPAVSNGNHCLDSLENILSRLERKEPVCEHPPVLSVSASQISVRQALLAPAKQISVENALGYVLATPSVGCPPAIPIAICGERICQEHIDAFTYYGIEKIWVIP